MCDDMLYWIDFILEQYIIDENVIKNMLNHGADNSISDTEHRSN